MNQWYILQVSKGQDKRIKEDIKSILTKHQLYDKIEDIIIPSTEEVVVKDGKRTKKKKNILNGYIFILGDMSNQNVPDYICSIRGVVGFIKNERNSKNNEPKPIRKSEIDRMLNQTKKSSNTSFLVEEEVHIIEGSFKGFKGKIVDTDENKQKANLEISIFGRISPIELDFSYLEKVK